MLPPIAMLTTKKLAQIFLIFSLGFLFVAGVTGCAPAGARALLKGQRLIKEGKYSEAVKKFEEATEALPDNAKAWNYLGLGYQYAGDEKKAAQAYQKALNLDRNLTSASYNLGNLYLEHGNFSEAIARLTTFIQLEPKNPDGWLKLGEAQMQLAVHLSTVERNRMLDTAKKNFETAQKLQPTAEALNALGMIETQRGHARDAVQNFAAALRQEPNFPPALLNLAVLYHQYLHEHRLALMNYNQFLKVAKDSPDAPQVELAVRQLNAELNPAPAVAANPSPTISSKPPVQASKPAPAREPAPTPPKTEVELPRVVTIPKPAPTISSPKAQTPPPKKETPVEVSRLPDEPTFRPARDVAVTASPKTSATSKSNVSVVNPERETNAPEKNTGVLTKLNPANWFKKHPKTSPTPLPETKPTIEPNANVSPEPNLTSNIEGVPRYRYRSPSRPAEGNRSKAEPYFAQGVKAQRDKHWREAISDYQNALKMDPSFFGAYYNLGLVAAEAGDLSAALNAYEYALAITPDSLNARYNFAYTLQAAGYFQDSAIELRKLLALNPNETRAHLLLGNLYSQRLGQPVAAREHYLKVLEMEPQHPQATQIRYWLAAHP